MLFKPEKTELYRSDIMSDIELLFDSGRFETRPTIPQISNVECVRDYHQDVDLVAFDDGEEPVGKDASTIARSSQMHLVSTLDEVSEVESCSEVDSE